MLGFEQVPCCEDDYSITNQEFHSFVSQYQIKDYENAISMIYEQHIGCSDENTTNESFTLDSDATSAGSQTDSEEIVSDSEDDIATTGSSFSSNSGASLMRRGRSNSTNSTTSSHAASEMHSVTKWYGMFIPAENALYLESPSTSELHSDCLTDILDVAECMNAFKVYIGIPRTRLDVVRQYLFAGFEIAKKGNKIEKQTPAQLHGAAHRQTQGTPAAGNNHILLEYEL